jgi:hypothetical protein
VRFDNNARGKSCGFFPLAHLRALLWGLGGLWWRGVGGGLAVGAYGAVALEDGCGGAELAVVGGDEVEASFDAVQEQETCAAFPVDCGGEPDFTVDPGGAEVEA